MVKMSASQITRRDFLKLVSSGSLAFALKHLRLDRVLSTPVTRGRMTISGVPLYDAPKFTANKIHHFNADQVVDITAVEENGEFGNPYNSSWYQVNGEGYTYSGWVQPVKVQYQRPVFNIPEAGQLGEITVPFCDAKQHPYVYARRGYRVYYGSTHWVKQVVVTREEKSIWYMIYDSKNAKNYYVPSHDMRLVSNEELSPLSPDVPDEEKRIVVDLKTQLVAAFEGETLVLSQRCSSGAEGTETPSGEFRTYHKGPSIHMTNQGDALERIYNLPGVPWCTFFTSMGNAFHGAYWHNDYGRPRSHGCVNLPSDAAKFLYRWTKPSVPPEEDYLRRPGEGTRIQVIS
jgi:lipoprotein-anchoring transpeptidase ErfK/SrfK